MEQSRPSIVKASGKPIYRTEISGDGVVQYLSPFDVNPHNTTILTSKSRFFVAPRATSSIATTIIEIVLLLIGLVPTYYVGIAINNRPIEDGIVILLLITVMPFAFCRAFSFDGEIETTAETTIIEVESTDTNVEEINTCLHVVYSGVDWNSDVIVVLNKPSSELWSELKHDKEFRTAMRRLPKSRLFIVPTPDMGGDEELTAFSEGVWKSTSSDKEEDWVAVNE